MKIYRVKVLRYWSAYAYGYVDILANNSDDAEAAAAELGSYGHVDMIHEEEYADPQGIETDVEEEFDYCVEEDDGTQFDYSYSQVIDTEGNVNDDFLTGQSDLTENEIQDTFRD